MTARAAKFLGLTAAAMAVGVGATAASCQQAATNVAVRALELPQKMDIVCLQVNDPVTGVALAAPIVRKVNDCPAVASTNTNPAALALHLYAAVTQARRGELGIVDLTAGVVVDVDRTTPGVDFVPVGADPTDLVVSPSGAFTFVSSADPNRFAIYAVDNAHLLGDSTGDASSPPRLLDLWACALQQPPRALAVVSEGAAADAGPAADGGAPDTSIEVAVVLGASAGLPAAVATVRFDPRAMAQGILAPCTVLGSTLLSDAVPASPAAGPYWSDGVPYATVGNLPHPPLGPTCPAVPLDMGTPPDAAGVPDDAGEAGMAPQGPDGADLDAGAPSGDAGEVGSADTAPADEASAMADDDGADSAAASDEAATDAESSAADAVAPTDAGTGAADALPLVIPPTYARPTAMALRTDVAIAYVADGQLPIIHVVDLRDPQHPKELAPLVATSVLTPHEVSLGSIALSPPTQAYKTFLYAIDATQGTLIVFDVTDPLSSPHVPLLRPHGELNPFAPPDRIAFGAPVVAVAFAQHDWPLVLDPTHSYTGIVCNPNPNAFIQGVDGGQFRDRGAYYRADQASFIQSMDTLGGTVQAFPSRLRGIFAFATLSNGNVVTIDVEDLDAPCRRPDPMSADTQTGALDKPEDPPGDAGDFDPYHAPITYTSNSNGVSAVSQEGFFPVSAPHRPRSLTLLRSDSTVGQRLPQVVTAPQLFSASGAIISASQGAVASPLLLPTPLDDHFVDPTYLADLSAAPDAGDGGVVSIVPLQAGPADHLANYPGCLFQGPDSGVAGDSGIANGVGCSPPAVRVAYDDPTAHIDQDWAITYEGALPTVSGLAADIASQDGYQTLTFSAQGAHFCAAGVEDWTVGQARAHQVLSAVAAAYGGTPPTGVDFPSLPQWTADYVEIVDDLLDPTDDYWTHDDGDCWDSDDLKGNGPAPAQRRYNYCSTTYGGASDADARYLRDLPIVRAQDQSLQVSRFAWGPANVSGTTFEDGGGDGGVLSELTTNRVVNPPDPLNAHWLKSVQCCFHRQATFKVRTGGEWLTVGSAVGLLHHVTNTDGSCQLSCDPRQALLNARAFDIPSSSAATNCTVLPFPSVDRDSPLAMRNPMFSYVMWGGCGPGGPSQPEGDPQRFNHTLSTRDLSWRFQMRGSSSPLSVSLLSQGSSSQVSPQSMRYIPPFGQMAVVDGEQQGLVLIDLNLMTVVRNYL